MVYKKNLKTYVQKNTSVYESISMKTMRKVCYKQYFRKKNNTFWLRSNENNIYLQRFKYDLQKKKKTLKQFSTNFVPR